MEYDITKVKWHVYITVNLDLTCMWIASPESEEKGEGIINLAGTKYIDKENPQSGLDRAEEGWKKYAEANNIKDYIIEKVGVSKESEPKLLESSDGTSKGSEISDAEVVD